MDFLNENLYRAGPLVGILKKHALSGQRLVKLPVCTGRLVNKWANEKVE